MKKDTLLNTITDYESFVQSVTTSGLYLVSDFDASEALVKSFDGLEVQATKNSQGFQKTQNTPDKSDMHESYYLLSTSGSEKKKHFLHTSSSIKEATESFLKTHPLDASDRWWLSLSTRHVAGFSILARSYFSKIKAPYEKDFSLDTKIMEEEGISLLSLVPTQIFDIVSRSLKAPISLKYVFVGGAPLSDNLFLKAKELGWPLVPCFGARWSQVQGFMIQRCFLMVREFGVRVIGVTSKTLFPSQIKTLYFIKEMTIVIRKKALLKVFLRLQKNLKLYVLSMM